MRNDGTVLIPRLAITSTSAPTATTWSAELTQALTPYLVSAQEQLAQGRAEEAVALWQAALHDVPGLPVPRRQTITGLIRTTAYDCARRRLQASPPDWRGAAAWLARWLGAVDGADATERWRVLCAYGMILHPNGRLPDAVRLYDEAASIGQQRWDEKDGPPKGAWEYASQLARLQVRALQQEPVAKRSPTVLPGVGTAAELDDASLRVRRSPHFGAWLARAASARLYAFESLLAGDVVQALIRFPRPDAPNLPRPWALEGALLAAMASRWRTSLEYYQAALADSAEEEPFADAVHRYVFIAVALQCAGEEDVVGADIEKRIMAQRLPDRLPRGLFADAQTYRKWAHAVRRWQQCLLVHDALRVLTAGDKDRLRQSLHAIVRVQKSAPVARWLRVWLACTGGLGGAAMERKRLLRESVAADDNPRHVLRLSVLAAERFGSPEEVVGRLNRLLQRFPDDEFGLARWRMWMVKLANKALDEGRFKQALLQYVSLILYLPDEPDGWAGCAKVLELMDEDKRAADCWRQALQAGKKARERWRRGNGTAIRAALEEASDDEGRVELDILRNLLVEPGSVPTADFPFTDDVLRNALMRSLHAPDVYVRFLLERWAEGPTSRASSG